MSGVLLLNATYEPIRVLSLRRAVVLVLQEKAEVIEEEGTKKIRSQNFEMAKPAVIRLKYFVKIPYRSRVPLTNRAVLNRDRYKCAYCGKRANTVDHVQPKAHGGRHEWTNVVAACRDCNSRKADKVPSVDNGWLLDFKPQAPTAKTWIVVGTPEKAEEWAGWLEQVKS